MSDENKPTDWISWLGFRNLFYFNVAKPLGSIVGALITLFALALFFALGLSLVMFFNASFSGSHLDARNYAVTLAAILAAPFVVWRAFVGQKLANIAEQGLITDRITKAVEQLGAEKTVQRIYDRDKNTTAPDGPEETTQNRYYSTSKSVPNLEVRLGGIYALERIAQDSERDHITVMEILCSYVRENADVRDMIYRKENVNPRADIKAVMTVIGRRSVDRITFERDSGRNGLPAPYRLDLAYTNLSRLNLTDMRLDHARFSSVDFSNAALRGTRFIGAVMLEAIFKEAWVDGADFTLAIVFKVDFTSAENLSDGQIQSMFGNNTTKIPNSATPPKWSTWLVSDDEANTIWIEAKAQAGM